MKKNIFVTVFIIIIQSASFHLFAQDDSKTAVLKLSTGFCYTDPSHFGIPQWAAYITPSIRFRQHEFYAGAFLTRRMLNDPFKAGAGVTTGYKYYFFKEPLRVNMFFHYGFQYVRYKRFSYNYRPWETNEVWITDCYNNIAGIGFNVYFDKKQRFSFYSATGIVFTLNWDKYETNHNASLSPVFSYLNVNLGFCFKLASFGKKTTKN